MLVGAVIVCYLLPDALRGGASLFDPVVVLTGYLLAAVPIAGVGLYVGGRIQTGLSQRAFQLVIRVLLLTSGLALLLKR